MRGRTPLRLGCLLLCIFCLGKSESEKGENVLTQSQFFQTLKPTGEFMFQFDQDEIFYVDLDKRETRWRLPQFGELASFEAAGALQNIAVLKHNLEVLKQIYNFTKANNVGPEIHTYSEEPVLIGEPNQLNCLATKFFPPVIKMSWLKNGQPIEEGVTQTDFYPASDGSFSMFIYLAIIPQKGEVYTCSVQHAGLPDNTTNKFWRPEVPGHISETTENIVCGLGLFFALCGMIASIVLICKGMKKNEGRLY